MSIVLLLLSHDMNSCLSVWLFFVFFKQKTAYEMRISDWSSDVCSSDLVGGVGDAQEGLAHHREQRAPLLGQAELAGHALEQRIAEKIGRASCRERVCQYV